MAREVVLVKQMELAKAPVHLIGPSPMMVHRFTEKAKRMMFEKQTNAVIGPKEPRNPWQDIIEGSYWLSEQPKEYTEEAFNKAVAAGARFGFPATGVKASACSGAYRNKLSKDKVSKDITRPLPRNLR